MRFSRLERGFPVLLPNMKHGSQEQLFTNNSLNSATSLLLPAHNVSQNVPQWPPSMSSSSGSATWMSSSSRGSSALPSPALMTQGSPPSSSSFDNGFDGAMEMEKMVQLARKLKSLCFLPFFLFHLSWFPLHFPRALISLLMVVFFVCSSGRCAEGRE